MTEPDFTLNLIQFAKFRIEALEKIEGAKKQLNYSFTSLIIAFRRTKIVLETHGSPFMKKFNCVGH